MAQQNSNHLYLVNSIISAPTEQYQKREFTMTKLLGSGGEGAVYAAKPKNCQYQKEIALKLQLNLKESENNFIQYVIGYQKLYDQDHNNCSGIIQIFEQFKYQNYHVLVMELGSQNLYDYIKSNQKLSIQDRYQICIDIIKPIQCIHNFQVFHRDIKPENFIKVGNQFKLIDFGLIKNVGQEINRTKGIGSLFYQAPELIENRTDYNEKVDSWALACVLFEILSGETLIQSQSENEIRQEISSFKHKKEKYFQRIDQIKIPQECLTTIKKMLDPNPINRYSISDAFKVFLQHQECSHTKIQPQLQQGYQTVKQIAQQTQCLQFQQHQQTFQPKLPQQQFQPQKQQPILQQGPQINATIEQFCQQLVKILYENDKTIQPSQNQITKYEQDNDQYQNQIDDEFKKAQNEILKIFNKLKNAQQIIKTNNQEMENKEQNIKLQEDNVEIKNNNPEKSKIGNQPMLNSPVQLLQQNAKLNLIIAELEEKNQQLQQKLKDQQNSQQQQQIYQNNQEDC